MYADACPHCGEVHPVADTVLPPNYLSQLAPEVSSVIKSVYDGSKSTNGLLKLIGGLLTDTVTESFSNVKVDWKTPDAEMLTRLTRDVWSFSAAKDYQQMRDLTLALRDETGKLREYDSFKTEAQNICDKYNEKWLRTEYDMAIASSQSAARWVDFTKDAKDIPFLKYQTVGDDHVRASHQVLDGIVRNIKDAFWSTHYPPNGWGCRCEAIQAPGIRGNQKEMPEESPVPEMFRTNLAQTGLIYPKNHPYYVGIPKAEIRKAIAYLPPENTYLSTNIGNKTVIDIHPLHGDKELKKNIDACLVLKGLDKKANIKLLPIIEEKDKAAKKLFLPDSYLKKYPLKNADMLYNKAVVEIEVSSGTRSSIQNCIKNGKQQADFIMLQLPDNTNLENYIRIAKGQMKHYADKEDLTLWLFNKDGKHEFTTKKKR